MQKTSYDTRLLAEHYDVQPQAIVWMRPVMKMDEEKITDFEFIYSNDEGLRYLNLDRESFSGLRLSVSLTLTD